MKKTLCLLLGCLLSASFAATQARAAQAHEVVVGVNVVGVDKLSQQQQDALIDQLEKAGVKTVRLGFGDKFTYFITCAFKLE